MVPVAFAAALLVPAVAAEALDLGGLLQARPVVSDPASPALPVSSVDVDATLLMMQEWRERHAQPGSDPQPQPEVPSQAQGGEQPTAVAHARDMADKAQDKAKEQAKSAQDQAGQEAQAAQDQADNLVTMVPKDPVGFATGTAEGAAQQAAQTLPTVFADPSLAPQDGGSTVVAPSDGLIPPILAGSILVAGAAGATFFAFWLAGSSGTVASGAAAAKSTELRRLLPFASPLFTRFEKETVLGHPRREALYALILQQPGVSLQSLGEATGLSRTAVLHHLRLLEMQHLVVSKRMGRSRHYYENGGRYGRDAKEAYAILQNQRSKEVAEFIRTHPGTMQKQLCEALAIQPSIAHWHVRRLQAAQLVECVRQGRAVNYFPGTSLLEVAAQVPLPEMPAAPAAVPSGSPAA
jgi:predicted transcriptional regulator